MLASLLHAVRNEAMKRDWLPVYRAELLDKETGDKQLRIGTSLAQV